MNGAWKSASSEMSPWSIRRESGWDRDRVVTELTAWVATSSASSSLFKIRVENLKCHWLLLDFKLRYSRKCRPNIHWKCRFIFRYQVWNIRLKKKRKKGFYSKINPKELHLKLEASSPLGIMSSIAMLVVNSLND